MQVMCRNSGPLAPGMYLSSTPRKKSISSASTLRRMVRAVVTGPRPTPIFSPMSPIAGIP
jgi:hypothetical protein